MAEVKLDAHAYDGALKGAAARVAKGGKEDKLKAFSELREKLKEVKHIVGTERTFAEQLDPYTKAPISVSPLTWSHATLVSLVNEYVRKRKALAA